MTFFKSAVLLGAAVSLSACTVGPDKTRDRGFDAKHLSQLVAGVWVDRVRRRPVLIATDVAQAVVFAAIGVTAIAGVLGVPGLAILMFVAGSLACVAIAANQSFIPRVVPPAQLPDAFGRLAVVSSVTDSVGPFAAGALVKEDVEPYSIVGGIPAKKISERK